MNIRTTKIISTFGIIIALGVFGLGLYSFWNNKDQVIPQIKGTLEQLKSLTSDSKFNALHTEALKAAETHYVIGSNWHLEFEGTDDADELGQVFVKDESQKNLVSKNAQGIVFADNKNPETNFARVFVQKLETIKVSGPSNVLLKDLSTKALRIMAQSIGSVFVSDSELDQLQIEGEITGDVQIVDSKIPNLELGLKIVGKIHVPQSIKSLSGVVSGTGTLVLEEGYDKSGFKNTLNTSNFMGDVK